MTHGVKIKGIMRMYIVRSEDDGSRFHPTLKDANADRKYLIAAGANGVTDVETVDLIVDSFTIRKGMKERGR